MNDIFFSFFLSIYVCDLFMTQPQLILASTSSYRQAQLTRLGLLFTDAAPICDETPFIGESAPTTAQRLASTKAYSLQQKYPKAIIIGADQVAWLNGLQLGKPLNVTAARTMLASMSGQTIEFYSALSVLNVDLQRIHTYIDFTCVTMRTLDSEQIERYLQREPDAIYCAGAAKAEGLGAALIERIDSTDPNALIGLPIFKLIEFLQQEGISVL